MENLTRVLKLQGRRHGDVTVRISWPHQEKSSWFCRWQIDWPDRKRSNVGGGVDAIQAMMHALEMVGTEIYCSDEHTAGELIWDDSWTGYGFPVAPNIRDRLVGDDKQIG